MAIRPHITYAFLLKTRAFDPDVVRRELAIGLQHDDCRLRGKLNMDRWCIYVVPPELRHSALRVVDRCADLMADTWLFPHHLDYAHAFYTTVISLDYSSGALLKNRITTVS